jgi:hypothetical protein
MSQVVEPIEVTYKRALTLWWNFTWPVLATLMFDVNYNFPSTTINSSLR